MPDHAAKLMRAGHLHAMRAARPWPVMAAGLLLLVALLMGGTLSGPGDTAVHVAAVLVMGLALLRCQHAELNVLQKAIGWLGIAAIGMGLAQLLPLPVGWIRLLPQRSGLLDELQLAGLQPAWLPMTLDVWGTVRTLLAVTTFLAMWMLCTTLSCAHRIALLKLAVVVAIPMALLGIAQSLYKPDTTGANGWFANRNHFATLMAMLLPACLAAARQTPVSMKSRRQGMIGMGWLWYGAALVLLLAAVLSFSRAGVILAGGSAVAAMILVRSDDRPTLRRFHRVGTAVAFIIAIIAGGYLAAGRLTDRFSSSVSGDLRWQYLDNGLEAMRAYLPWGGGLGSFRYVYEPYEPLTSMGEFTFAHHAHNELLQVGIEAGLPGLTVAVGFIVAVAITAARALRVSRTGSNWTRAAAIACLVPLLHSLVDYPLRTFACSMVFALVLSIAVAAPHRAGVVRREARSHPPSL